MNRIANLYLYYLFVCLYLVNVTIIPSNILKFSPKKHQYYTYTFILLTKLIHNCPKKLQKNKSYL